MRSIVATAVGLSAAVALMQAHSGRTARPQGRRARGSADAGSADGGSPRVRRPGPFLLGTDPPGKLRPFAESPDAGAPRRIPATDETQRELQQLRARVDMLEQQRAQEQQQAQQLQEVVQQLQQLRSQIAQGDQRKAAAEQEQQAQEQQRQAGVSALQQAQESLALGNSAVDDQLAQAQASFPPQAQRDIEYARTALRNRDLSAARAYLGTAIHHAQQGQ